MLSFVTTYRRFPNVHYGNLLITRILGNHLLISKCFRIERFKTKFFQICPKPIQKNTWRLNVDIMKPAA